MSLFRAFIPFVNLVDLNVQSLCYRALSETICSKYFPHHIFFRLKLLKPVNLDGKLISEAIFLFWSSFYRSIHPLFLKDLLLMFVNLEKKAELSIIFLEILQGFLVSKIDGILFQ